MDSKSYQITAKDSVLEYSDNADFRRLIESGFFVYAEGTYVLNDPKWVENVDGGLVLTERAKLNPDQCCISFGSSDPSKTGSVTYALVTLEESENHEHARQKAPAFCLDSQNKKVLDNAMASGHFRAQAKEFKEFSEWTANSTFSETTYLHTERLGINRVVFCEKTLLGDKQFWNIKTNKMLRPSFDTSMAICVGLGLGLLYGEPLLEKGGHKLDHVRDPYRVLLANFRGLSIFECNEFLIEWGIKPLREREYKLLSHN